MRNIALIFALSLATFVGSYAEPSLQGTGTSRDPAILNPDVVPTIFAKFGMLTSVTLVTDKPFDAAPMKGGAEINLFRDGNVLQIQPTVNEGMSSVTFRVAGVTYMLKVRITTNDPAIPNPVFTFPKSSRFSDNDRAIASAPSLKPLDIDLNGTIKVVERATYDATFRDTLRAYAVLPIHKVYHWNHCDINLVEAHQFADQDLILFKISWVNSQNTAFYLNANQYRLYVSNHQIGIQVRRQLAPRSIIYPGQQETVWLAVQGYKLRLDNDWDLGLPPDAADLRPYIRQ
jgi:hypothetical protein